MATFSGDLLLPRLSLLPRGGTRLLPRGGVKRGVFSAGDVSDHEVRRVLKILPHPLPTLVAIVPQKHIAALERNGKFVKMIGSGRHYLFPFFEKVNGVYRNEYPIPELTGFDVGGTIKLQLIDMARHQEQSVDVVMAKARTVLEEMISESYLFEGVVNEKCNKFAEEKINQKLVEDPTNNYSMVLNMRYVKKLSPTEDAERVKENMRQKKIMRLKEEEKKDIAIMARHVAAVILGLIGLFTVPKELRVFIIAAMQIYLISVAESFKENMRQKKIMREKEEEEEEKNIAIMARHVAVVILALIGSFIVPKEIRVFIIAAMQIYLFLAYPRGLAS